MVRIRFSGRCGGRCSAVVEQRRRASRASAVAVVGGREAQRRGGTARVGSLPGAAGGRRPALRWSSSERAAGRRPVELETSAVGRGASERRASRPRHRGSRNTRNTCPQLPEMPHSGPGVSVVDARIPCMTTAFDDTGQHPVTSAIAAVSQQLATSPTSDCGPCPGRDRRQPDRPGRSCGTRSPSSSCATPTTPTASTSAPRPAPPTPAATGPTPPGRPNATPSGAWRSRTPWTTTTSRSGTRWPPARSPRSRPR